MMSHSRAKKSLGQHFLTNPAIAKRKDFQRGSMSDRELEIIKLEDAISIHQDTKKELEVYLG